jgi:hypothetical protein
MREIVLTQNKVSIVDDNMFELVGHLGWLAARNGKNWYASRFIQMNGRRKRVFLHQVIAGYPLHNNEIDHIDGDGLNNLRSNIRIVSHRINMANRRERRDGLTSSRHVGVCWHSGAKKWCSQIRISRNRKVLLGFFDQEQDAAEVYQKALTAVG